MVRKIKMNKWEQRQVRRSRKTRKTEEKWEQKNNGKKWREKTLQRDYSLTNK